MERTRNKMVDVGVKDCAKRKNYGGFVWPIIKFLVFVFIFYVFSISRIFGVVMPGNFGIFVSICLGGENVFLLCLSFITATILGGVNSFELVFYFLVVTACLLGNLFFGFKKKKAPLYFVTLVCAILGIAYCGFYYKNLNESFLNAFFNVVSCVCFNVFYSILRKRRLNFTLQIDEAICFGFCFCCLFCGLGNLNFFIFDIVKFVGIFLIIVLSLIFSLKETLLVSVLAGVGVFSCGGNLSYLLLFCLISLVAQVFKGFNKIFTCISVLCVDLCVELIFYSTNDMIVVNLIPTGLALVLFFAFSKQLTFLLKKYLALEGNSSGIKEIFDNDKIFLSQKLLTTSEIFYEMDKNFRKLVIGKLDEKNSKIMICNEILRENCENCENKTRCIKNFDREIKKVFEDLTNIGFEKGKITLLDLPAYITNRCTKVNSIVNSYNLLLDKYRKYSRQKTNVDNSKLLVAYQLRGISNMLKNLAEGMKREIVEDKKLEEKIKDGLTYNNIVPIEVVCFEESVGTSVVELIVRSVDFDAGRIKEILRNVYKKKMIVDKLQALEGGANVCVRFITAPIFDISVGFCQEVKGGESVCGDTFTATKLNKSKFLMGVCDGMGHGEKANKASEIAMSIIEDFYKAGFDSEIILTSVNSLLGLQQDETFSALDVGIVDLKTGEIDFVKQGATSSFILSKDKVFRIESSGLPLGILSEIRSKVVKTVLTPEDFVVIVSDGVIDSFRGEENFENYLLSIKNKNPQEVAENIIKRANKNFKNYPNDDMTALVGKLFYF